MDEMVSAIADNAQLRCYALRTTDTVEYARAAHNTSPVVTAALGRLISGALMIAHMGDNEKGLLTLQIDGDGDVGGLVVTATPNGQVKGYAKVPDAICPANSIGKLDVGRIVGNGFLTVIRDTGAVNPYNSRTELISGEIGDDLANYFSVSEQVPSSVGLGVLMNRDNTVKAAGGFIIQLMPFASDECIDRLEEALSHVSSVTSLLDKGYDPEGILRYILSYTDVSITDRLPVSFKCDCDMSRIERALISLGKSQLRELSDGNEPLEIKCQFCNKSYEFTPQRLSALIKSIG